MLSGILIAFGLDAGWGVLQDRAEVRESLVTLEREFESARVQLDSVMAVNERAIAASERFIRMDVSAAEDLTEEEAQVLSMGLGRADTFDPGESALTALVSGNVLERIGDSELRALVAGWSGRVNDVREEQAAVREAESAIRQRLATAGLYIPTLGSQAAAYSPRASVRMRLQDEVTRQLYAVRRNTVGLMLLEQRGLSDAVDRILELISASLE